MKCENRFCIEWEHGGICNRCFSTKGWNNLCGRRVLYLKYIKDAPTENNGNGEHILQQTNGDED